MAVALGGLLGTASPATAVPPTYTVAEVPVPADLTNVTAIDINNNGDVLVDDSQPDRAYRVRADGTVDTLTASGSSMTVSAMNDSGAVVGQAGSQIARWAGDGTSATLVGTGVGGAADIATDGTLVGTAIPPNVGRAVKQAPGGALVDLTTPAPGTDVGTQARAINAAGQIAGDAQSPGYQDPYGVPVQYCGDGWDEQYGCHDPYYDYPYVDRYFKAVLWSADGTPTLIQIPHPDPYSSQYTKGLNDSGDVLVENGGDRRDAYIWHTDGSYTHIDRPLGGRDVYANAINNDDQVVGLAESATGVSPFLYEESTNTAYDLNDLVPADSGWDLRDAVDITNDGVILGLGFHDGARALFTLTPPAPTLPPGDAVGEVRNGGTVTTDPGNDGASAAVPVQTTVVAPTSVSGTIRVTSGLTTETAPTGFDLFGRQLQLDGPAATAAAPYVVTFTVDSSLLNGVAPADTQVFRNGVPVGDCSDPTAAVPDPCVAARSATADGDAVLTVRTSHFSTWNLGRLSYIVSALRAPSDSPTARNVVRSGAVVPVKFSLGGDRGLSVFTAGYPRSAASTDCATGGTPGEPTVTAGSSSLTYDATTATYSYAWKTARDWAGCRLLTLRFRDGTVRTAMFRFNR